MSANYVYPLCPSLGSLPISVEVKSSQLDDDTDLPPPIPPKQFSEEELFPTTPPIPPKLFSEEELFPTTPPIPPKLFSKEELFPLPPKHSESGKSHCKGTPPFLLKTNQEGSALTPLPPSIHQKSGEL